MRKQKQNKSVLILDIDGCLNTEYPSLVLNKNQELVAKDPYGPAVWSLFRESAHNLKAPPQFLPYYHFPSFKDYFEKIFIISARLEDWREATEAWLSKWGFTYDALFLRPNKLMKLESHQFKKLVLTKEILSHYKPNQCVACDDDKSICVMYEESGVKAYQSPIDWSDFLIDFNLSFPSMSKDKKLILTKLVKKELLRGGKTKKEIARELGISYKTLLNLKLKVKAKPNLNKINIEPFKRLTTEQAAYLTGAVSEVAIFGSGMSDGHVYWCNEDSYILTKIQAALKVDSKITATIYGKYCLTVAQLSLANILTYRWGIVSDSSRRKFPRNIPLNMMHHHVRGIFDSIGNFRECYPYADVVFKHENKSYLEDLEKILHKFKIEDTLIYVNEHQQNVLSIKEGSIKNFVKWIYKGATLFDDFHKTQFDYHLKLSKKLGKTTKRR